MVRKSKKNSLNKWKKLRKETLDITQKDFARLLGVSQATVTRWEDPDQGPKRDDTVKLEILDDLSDEDLKALKTHIDDEDIGIDAVSLLLDSATKGKKNLKTVGLCSGLLGAGPKGLFGIGGNLLRVGGAEGAYKLLKKVFDSPDEPKKG
jgi:DNA-binding XRE family transcriptional regulator